MLMVISPAKTLDFDTAPTTQVHTMPVFMDEAQVLIDQLRKLSPPQVSELMGISDKLGQLNYGRYEDWSRPFTASNAKQAVLAFKGDVYTGLDAEHFTEKQLQWAQDHLRMLSGLYGLLRPLDLMQAYRLEMGTKFANTAGKNLYEFWGTKITDALNADLSADLNANRNPVLLNLASNEYFKSVQLKQLNAEVITPVFKDWKGGKYKIISFYAKKARGLMSAYVIKNRIKNVEKIKQFDVGGYQYNEAMSNAKEWVFTREEAA